MADRHSPYTEPYYFANGNTPSPNNDPYFNPNSPYSYYYETDASPQASSLHLNDYPLVPPRAPFHPNAFENPRSSFSTDQISIAPSYSASINSRTGLSGAPLISPSTKGENLLDFAPILKPKKRRSPWIWVYLLAGLAIVGAIAVVIYLFIIKPKLAAHAAPAASLNTDGTSDNGLGTDKSQEEGKAKQRAATTGGDGSTVTTEDGSTFIYKNNFGGFWVDDPKNPFNESARPNSWTPPLDEKWNWETDRIYGVNLGGLFVLEPFISPAIFQKYPGTKDEWDVCVAMAADKANGGLGQLEEHYKTFITEKDMAEIAAAGLNWVRLPIGFWAVDVWPGEPYLERTSWKYILRVIGWARKYGIRVNLDLHTAPGSQNGNNHSGRGIGQVNVLKGPMGFANAQRTLYYIRVLTEFFSQPEYANVVPMFSVLNEPPLYTLGRDAPTSFYLEAHRIVRDITGVGEGNGPFIAIHDGFSGLLEWESYPKGSDRLILDSHPYLAFSPLIYEPMDTKPFWPTEACKRWANDFARSRNEWGVTIAGEYSLAFNDCGLYLLGIPGGHKYTGDCSLWEDSTNWTPEVKAGLKQFALGSMDSFQDGFFWTWSIGPSLKGIVEAPLWSYKLGLDNGWMPLDPRESIGICQKLGVSRPAFNGKFQPWQTGGVGAGDIPATATAQYPWPPKQFTDGLIPSDLPSYTATGTVVTLPPPTFTSAPDLQQGNGWFNPGDTELAPAPIQGCVYPDAYTPDQEVPPKCPG